jgi:PKD repeat protein
VEEAIEGLWATNDSPTPLGSATTLTATITAGSNVTYNWAFGDGDTGSGAVVAHTYPAVGVYTAIVTASNSVSLLTATTPVTITDAFIEELVANNDSPTVLGQDTTLTATITKGSNVVYTWALGDGDTGSGAVVAHTYPAIGTYTAVVTASNSVSVVTATTPITIIEALKLYLPIILKDYTPPSEPPTATPTSTSTSPPPTATPTPTSPLPTATPTSTSPPTTGPDLVVTDISVVPDPPEAGQSATVYVTVKNQGNQGVPYGNNFYVDFYVDHEPAPLLHGDIEWGVQFSWFGAGESYTLDSSYTFTEGTHQLWGQADTDNTVVETDENNNVLGPVTLDVTSLGGGEAPTRPVIIPTPGAGSPRPTPSPAP